MDIFLLFLCTYMRKGSVSVQPTIHSGLEVLWIFYFILFYFILFYFYLLIWERERERERETLICCSTYWYIHWLILVCALTGDGTHSLVYRDSFLTNWATWPRQDLWIFYFTDCSYHFFFLPVLNIYACMYLYIYIFTYQDWNTFFLQVEALYFCIPNDYP